MGLSTSVAATTSSTTSSTASSAAAAIVSSSRRVIVRFGFLSLLLDFSVARFFLFCLVDAIGFPFLAPIVPFLLLSRLTSTFSTLLCVFRVSGTTGTIDGTLGATLGATLGTTNEPQLQSDFSEFHLFILFTSYDRFFLVLHRRSSTNFPNARRIICASRICICLLILLLLLDVICSFVLGGGLRLFLGPQIIEIDHFFRLGLISRNNDILLFLPYRSNDTLKVSILSTDSSKATEVVPGKQSHGPPGERFVIARVILGLDAILGIQRIDILFQEGRERRDAFDHLSGDRG
mmetsp:Transcript_28580/g.82735  ORF Transcript_28580/g.82735 Transcript_28580/m.82735 type:complete len:291 (+) Transcript_28580:396-1268(+)